MRYLLLAYEVEIFPVIELAKRLESEGHEVLIFRTDVWSLTSSPRIQKHIEKTGFLSKSNDILEEFKQINKLIHIGDVDVDWCFLKELEFKYCKHRLINELLNTDQCFSLAFHSRQYIAQPENKLFIYKYIELLSKKILGVLESYKPDSVFSLQNNYFVKNLFYELTSAKEIPFVCYVASRIEDYYYPCSNFALGTPETIQKKIQNSGFSTGKDKAQKILTKLQKSEISATASFIPTHQKALEGSKIFYHIKKNIFFFKQLVYAGFLKKRFLRGWGRANYFDTYAPKTFKHLLISSYSTLRFFKLLKKYPDINFHRKYVYLTLHVMPEDSTLTLSKDSDEEYLVKRLSASLPIDYMLYIKENPAMLKGIDRRRWGFYDTITKLPNVQLISPEIPSLKLIKYSRGVVSINGTNLLEGALLGKPAFRIGYPEFCDVDGIFKLDFDLLKTRLEEFRFSEDNNHLKYLQAIVTDSVDIDIRYLLYGVTNNRLLEDKYQKQIDRIYHNFTVFLKNMGVVQ